MTPYPSPMYWYIVHSAESFKFHYYKKLAILFVSVSCPGVRDHVCAVCGSAYFSSKGLRKHERGAHPDLKPTKPKPFKISGATAEGLTPANQEQGGLLPANHERGRLLPGNQERGRFPPANQELSFSRREQLQQQLIGSEHNSHSHHASHQHLANGHAINHSGDEAVAAEMNLQLAYAAAAMNRNNNGGTDPRLQQFFNPLRS